LNGIAIGTAALAYPDTLRADLAGAHFYRAHRGPGSRILLLDNHDGFGGHAKRNEFQ
jgi:hypothetical protein